MDLRNIFKKKSKEKSPKEKLGLSEKSKEEVPFVKPIEVKPKIRKKEIIGDAWRILKAVHITEKATDLAEKNQYIFKLWPRANKSEIKKAIEGLYGVNVVSVKIINIPKKRKRLGKISGWRTGYKKAIVKVKEGQKIEVLPR